MLTVFYLALSTLVLFVDKPKLGGPPSDAH
jgi:hypothetical protein